MKKSTETSENNTDNTNADKKTTTISWSDWAHTVFSCTPKPPQASNRALYSLFACAPGILPQTLHAIEKNEALKETSYEKKNN